jgi:hypothetical protein
MELILTEEERELLLTIVERRYHDLQTEISHTDHHEFKLVLRRHEELLESMMSRLRKDGLQEVA